LELLIENITGHSSGKWGTKQCLFAIVTTLSSLMQLIQASSPYLRFLWADIIKMSNIMT